MVEATAVRTGFRRVEVKGHQFLVNGQRSLGASGTQVASPKDELREIIERVTPRTWKKDKARMLRLLEEI